MSAITADNASTISLAGSVSARSCSNCETVMRNAAEHEQYLKQELDSVRSLAERYELELAEARLALSKLMHKSSFDSEENVFLAHMNSTMSEKRRHFHQSHSTSTDDGQPRDANVFARGRRMSEGCATMAAHATLSIHHDAPPSYEEKKWWKGEEGSPRCPRGCGRMEEPRREHYKKWHYNVYYAFVNHEDGYSERDRWMGTLFGDKQGGLRACLHCVREPSKYILHCGQLDLAKHINEHHPDIFYSLAVQHSRHCANIAATQKIPMLPDAIDMLLEKTLNARDPESSRTASWLNNSPL